MTQTYRSHRKWTPLYHFVAQPILVANVVVSAVAAARRPSGTRFWALAVALAIEALAIAARAMALTVQNRVVRLEQRLRLEQVLPAELLPDARRLGTRQLIGLRFASDDELPELVRRVARGELATTDAIKRAVTDWQPDHLRA